MEVPLVLLDFSPFWEQTMYLKTKNEAGNELVLTWGGWFSDDPLVGKRYFKTQRDAQKHLEKLMKVIGKLPVHMQNMVRLAYVKEGYEEFRHRMNW